MDGRQSVQTSASASQRRQSGKSPGQGQDPPLQGHLPHLAPNDSVFELELDEPRLPHVHHSYLEIL